MSDQWWNYIVTFVGLFGFWLGGKKVWWAWYVNIANQILWFTFGVVTEQWGFVIGTFFYTPVFIRNAYLWTKEHRGEPAEQKAVEPIGTIRYVISDEFGVHFEGDIDPDYKYMLHHGDLVGVSVFKQPEINLQKTRWHWKRFSPIHIWQMSKLKKQLTEEFNSSSLLPIWTPKTVYKQQKLERSDLEWSGVNPIDMVYEEVEQENGPSRD